jgi:hypothetical protein
MDDTDSRPFPAFLANWCSARSRTRRSLRLRASSVRQDHTGPRFGRGQSRIHYHWTAKRVLAAARSDPTGLVRALDRATIDEVQRVPDLSPGHQEVSR